MRRLIPIVAAATPLAAMEAIRASDARRGTRLRRSSPAHRLWDEAHREAVPSGPRQAAQTARHRDRRWYIDEVQPHLSTLQLKDVAQALAVSRAYAKVVIGGYVPHPRHFATLASLVGVPVPKRLANVP